jgi:hypothetical protein
MYQCINVSMYQCINVSMYQCINVSMYQCINVSCINENMGGIEIYLFPTFKIAKFPYFVHKNRYQ